MVGVGASAGGLDAFGQLLHALPAQPGLALVLVQHLSPNHDSTLPELLARTTAMPVQVARDGTVIRANQVYVVPPNTQLTVAGGRLKLAPRPTDRTQYNSIDALFRSLAEWAGARAMGVLLSGTSADGVQGLKEIRAVGGTALAQDPETTEYDMMPRAAIAAGVVDLVLPPAQLGDTLARLAADPLLSARDLESPSPEAGIADQHLRRIFTLLRAATGVDFSHYKEPTIRRRLHRRMMLQKISAVERYIKLLDDDPTEVHNLYNDLLIQVTRFFRDPESYVALAAKVFPRLMGEHQADVPIRIWIPGCSTGEEAYSVAIALTEFLADDAPAIPVQVFATDISDRAIERARAGIYPASITEDVTPQRLRRFFNKVDGGYQISKAIRDLCVFAHQDLTRDPPFSKLDLIVCRNVLIYLDPVLHRKLMTVFHYALKPNGFLVLGRAESPGPSSDLFALFEKKHRIFLRKASVARMEVEFKPVEAVALKPAGDRKTAARAREGSGIQGEATRVLVSRYAPPGVIVDNDLRIVQTRGQTGAFLELAPGEPTLNLLKMLREGLLFGVRAVINEARKTDRPARHEGIKLRSNGGFDAVDVEVIPLGASAPADRHYLVLFERHPLGQATDDAAGRGARPSAGAPGRGRQASKGAGTRSDEPRVADLQQELAASREYLQSIIQDLEATNEELQSANEEILSSNEELQSTNEELDTAKEELQSTNEEINTVNEELQSRNEELSRANSDLVNLLAGVQIAIVFLTSDLRVRRFTPMAEKALNLIASDVGRPIGNIRPNIDCPDLEALIHDAVDNVTVKEREVKDHDGHHFLLRVRPYKSVENRIDGAVLVLLDIDAVRKHEQRSREAQGLAAAILDTMDQPLVALDTELRAVAANRAFVQRFGPAAATDGAWDLPELRARLAKPDRGDGFGAPMEVVRELPRGARQKVLVKPRRLGGGPGHSAFSLLAVEEVEVDDT